MLENRRDIASMVRIISLLTGFLLLVGGTESARMVGAQGASAECVLSAVGLPLFDGTPAAEIPGAKGTPASPDDPGREATDAEIEEFAASIDVILGCINTGDAQYANAIFTERYLASKFADPNVLYQPDFERMIAENSGNAPDSVPLELDSIEDVVVREDGRVSGRVTFSSAGTSWRDTLVLKQVDEHWLIDDVIFETR
jgi:hypothetical protein